MSKNTIDGIPKQRSQLAEIWRRYRRNKAAVAGVIILLFIIAVALLAPVIAPEGYDVQNISEALRPPFSPGHLLGTDNNGRDMLARIVWGAQVTLKVGLVAVAVSFIGGMIFGSIAGYFGGVVDNIIMRIMDVLLAIPGMLLAIAIAAALGAGMTNAIISVGIAGVPGFARMVRSSIMSIREQEYIEAARTINAGHLRIIFKDILPNCLAPILVMTTLSIANAIMQTASLSFLGLGIQLPVPEWGSMISAGRQFLSGYAYMVFVPGIAIMLVVFAINVIGDGLRDALDPKLKR